MCQKIVPSIQNEISQQTYVKISKNFPTEFYNKKFWKVAKTKKQSKSIFKPPICSYFDPNIK